MWDFFYHWGLFAANSLTLVIAVVAGLIVLISAVRRSRDASPAQSEGTLSVELLNDSFEDQKQLLRDTLISDAEYKEQERADKHAAKEKAKAEKAAAKAAKKARRGGETRTVEAESSTLYVLDFDGDVYASQVDGLRREINAILQYASGNDEVLVRLHSGGGTVDGYGLGASQLDRIRRAGIRLTVSVDRVAASGGYMMACVADRILAAPFAYIGSIGVVAEIPNAHRLLQRADIDYEVLTAGEYKRTMTVFGENTDAGREKMQNDLEVMHRLFTQHIGEHRRNVNLEEVATGEVWCARDALEKQLVDELKTSDDYLLEKYKDCKLLKVSYRPRQSLGARLGITAGMGIGRVLTQWLNKHPLSFTR